MKKEKAPAGGKGSKIVDLVSQDKDWRDVISNELRCAEGCNKEWSFLADDTSIKLLIIR